MFKQTMQKVKHITFCLLVTVIGAHNFSVVLYPRRQRPTISLMDASTDTHKVHLLEDTSSKPEVISAIFKVDIPYNEVASKLSGTFHSNTDM